ncbi:ANTAR domain-containing protein [Nocardia sp. CC227C]|uniref:ANTAR domain-containing protein n=1 Tax=Nocardia sp. CC227C TaxID=3044562 RepID=UPI00278BF3A6|nr:ANTAR domain-containing protein [Nocardia sp. CC227C]
MRPADSVAARFLAELRGSADGRLVARPSGDRLCLACTRILPISGAAVTAITDSGRGEILGTAGTDAAWLADAQAATGEGPGQDAHRNGAPVRVPDMSAMLGSGRWPLLAQWDGTPTIAAVCSIPLQLGAIRLGYLDLLDAATVVAEPAAYRDALSVAGIVTAVLLAALTPPQDGIASGVGWELSTAAREIHQATGMVAVQLNAPAGVAYARLVGHAFAVGRRVDEVAADVVARNLRFFPDGGPDSGHGSPEGPIPAPEH